MGMSKFEFETEKGIQRPGPVTGSNSNLNHGLWLEVEIDSGLQTSIY